MTTSVQSEVQPRGPGVAAPGSPRAREEAWGRPASSHEALRVAFAGTPAFAAQALQALAEAGHRLPLVLTQPDRPAGRGLQLQPSAVKQCAAALGLPVAQPRGLRLDGRHAEDASLARQQLLDARPDVLVVVDCASRDRSSPVS